MNSANRWTFILGLAGIILLGLGLFIFDSDKNKIYLPEIGSIIEFSGDVFTQNKSSQANQRVSKITSVYPMESIETLEASEALLRLGSGEEIRILESSVVNIDNENGKTLLVVVAGDLQVEKSIPNQDLVRISKAGTTWSLGASSVPMNQPSNGQAPTTNKVSSEAPGLDSTSIQETLKTHRNYFFKCYAIVLQDEPGLRGEAQIGFTIDPSGKVSRPEITSSSISDIRFQKCLIDVITRVEFKSFKGKPISMIFPLKFE